MGKGALRKDPSANIQAPEKHQISSSKHLARHALSWVLGASLELGCWGLELFLTQQFVRFGRKDEIAFSQPIDFVGPDREFHPTPGEVNIRMVALRLG